MVNNSSVDRKNAANIVDGKSTTYEKTVNVQTLERCLTKQIDKEPGILVVTIADRNQNAILPALDNMSTPTIKPTVRSNNAPSGKDTVSVTANSELGNVEGLLADLKTFPKRATHFMKGTRMMLWIISDELSELSIPEAQYD